MKSLFRWFIISLKISFLLITCSCVSNENDASASRSSNLTFDQTNHRGVYFSVRGLVCESCVNKLQRNLLSKKGVTEAEAFLDRENNNVKIIYDPALISIDQLREAIEEYNEIDDFEEF